MSRRGFLRVAVFLSIVSAAIVLMPSFRTTLSIAPLAVSPVNLLAVCNGNAEVHAGDGLALFGPCWYKPTDTSGPAITVVPCLGAGPRKYPWQLPDVYADGSAAAGGATLLYGGPTAVIADDGQDPHIVVHDVIGGLACPGGGGPGGGCAGGGCGGGACAGTIPQSAGGNPNCFDCVPGVFGLGSVHLRFPLGMANEYRSAGVLKLAADVADPNLGTPGKLEYDLKDSFSWSSTPIQVIKDPSDATVLRQIRTQSLLADIVVTTSGSAYSVRLFTLADLASQDATTHVYSFAINAHSFREWQVSYSTNVLTITDKIWNGSSLDTRAIYVYQYTSGTLDSWTLTTKDGNSDVVRTEMITGWTEDRTTTPITRTRTYVITQGTETIYEHDETQADFGSNNWRRISLLVNPGATDERTTTWNWSATVTGLNQANIVLTEVTYPDGSWMTFDYDYTSGMNPTFAITSTSPWQDGAGDNLTVKRTLAKVEGTNGYRLVDELAQVGSTMISHTAWEYDATGAGPFSVVESQYTGTSVLDTISDWHYEDLPGNRYDGAIVALNQVEKPDGTATVVSDGSSGLTLSSYPNGGHTPVSGTTYRVHQSALYGSAGLVNNQSTRTSAYVDSAGRPWYSETHVWNGSAWGGPIRWTSWAYDGQGRETARWSNDGTVNETEYSSCCGRTVTDTQGIATTTTRDVLGRVIHTARAGVQTDYDYQTTPFVVTATTSPEDPNSPIGDITTVTTLDMHGRPTKVIANSQSSTGALATLYEYGTASGGGEKVTVYSDYPATAESGDIDVRSRVTEHYRDGRVKRVYGAAMVESLYEYPTTGLSTKVTTGPTAHTSEQITYYDWLGRVDYVNRDGWASGGGTSTLTTNYVYDDSTAGQKGRLVKVESTGQPSTLYHYDTFGRVDQTVIDVDNNGSIGESGSDRISESVSTIEQINGDWWSIQKSYTYPTAGSDTQLQISEQRAQLSGFDSGTIRVAVSIDKLNSNNTTTSTVTVDRGNQTRVETTEVPESSTEASSTYVNGNLTSAITTEGVSTTYQYDDLNRKIKVTDARGNDVDTVIDATGRVYTVTNENGDVTTYAYYLGSDSGATTSESGVWPGRVKSVLNPGGKYTYYAYTDRGELWRTWGDVPYPTEYDYDGHGRQSKLWTFRTGTFSTATWPTDPPYDETIWNYHDATGLLNNKHYDDGTEVTYTYTSDGKIASRTWARGVTTTYNYYLGQSPDLFTGELKSVDYPGTGDDLTYAYDRMGRIASVTDVTGSRTMDFSDTTLAPTTETFNSGNWFAGTVVTQTYQGSGEGLVSGRWSGVKIGIAGGDDAAYYTALYGYDGLGRLSTVAGPGLPAGGAEYTYLLNGSAQTGLPEKTNFKDGSANVLASAKTTFETTRNLIWKAENLFGAGTSDPISKYEYKNDARARRQGVVYSGAAFGGGFIDDWSYNDRNEVVGADRLSGTDPGDITTDDTLETSVTSIYDRRYTYDNIGNRSSSNAGEPINDPNQPAWSYTPNSLNQYTDVTQPTPFNRQTLEYDADGNITLMFSVGDVDGDGDTDTSDLSLLYSHLGDDCDDIVNPPNHLTAAEFARADFDGDCSLDFGPDFTGLLGGYGSSGATNFVALTWDAENRLIQVEPQARNASTGAINSNARRVNFAYDYRGRRVEKRVYQRDSSDNTQWAANPVERRRYVWNGWLMLRELIDEDGGASFSATRTKNYTWGKDMGGSLESAGGIGGLLAVYDDNGESADLAYVYMYDANGNVGQLCDLSQTTAAASIVAKYEYDAYGNPTVSTGSYAASNTYRFSTKPWDDETGLGYWGYRYYDPRLGRWMSRDPIGEAGGWNLYGSNGDPVNHVDSLGRCAVACNQGNEPPRTPFTRDSCWPNDIDDYYCGDDYCNKKEKARRGKSNAGGSTQCRGKPENRRPCFCLYRDNARELWWNDMFERKVRVDEKALDVYMNCAMQHEIIHVIDYLNSGRCDWDNTSDYTPEFVRDTECAAWATQFQCMGDPWLCSGSPTCCRQVIMMIGLLYPSCVAECQDSSKCRHMANDAMTAAGKKCGIDVTPFLVSENE